MSQLEKFEKLLISGSSSLISVFHMTPSIRIITGQDLFEMRVTAPSIKYSFFTVFIYLGEKKKKKTAFCGPWKVLFT